jgi:hypothetical protein
MKNFYELSEREILALAISPDEEDERVYADFFEGLRHPADSPPRRESIRAAQAGVAGASSGSTRFASTQALSKSRIAGSMNEPRRVPRMPVSGSFWMISHRKNARMKIEPRN